MTTRSTNRTNHISKRTTLFPLAGELFRLAGNLWGDVRLRESLGRVDRGQVQVVEPGFAGAGAAVVAEACARSEGGAVLGIELEREVRPIVRPG